MTLKTMPGSGLFFPCLALLFYTVSCSPDNPVQKEVVQNDSASESINRTTSIGKSVDPWASKLKKSFTSREIAYLDKSKKYFLQINNQHDLRDFYLNTADSVKRIVRAKINTQEDGYEEGLNWIWFTDYFPVFKIQPGCSECPADVYLNLSAVFEKAKTTSGNEDDYFFELVSLCYGEEEDSVIFDNKAGNWTIRMNYDSTEAAVLGGGKHLKVLAFADQYKNKFPEQKYNLFNSEVAQIRTWAMPAEEKFFGYSKDKVLEELNHILKHVMLVPEESQKIERIREEVEKDKNLQFAGITEF